MNCSVSRLAVPLPMAIASIWYCSTNFTMLRAACGIHSWADADKWFHCAAKSLVRPDRLFYIRTVARINSMTRFCPKGGASKLSQVSGEDADCLLVGFLPCSRLKIRFRWKATLVRITHCLAYLAAFIVATDIHLFQPSAHSSSSGLIITFNRPSDSPRRIASRQWRNSVSRFAEIEIIAVFGSFFLFAFHHFGGDDGLSENWLRSWLRARSSRSLVRLWCRARLSAHPLRLSHLPFTKRGDGCPRWFRVAITVGGKAVPVPFLPCRFGAGLRLIGQIYVFHFGGIPTLFNAFAQFFCQFACSSMVEE